MVLQDIFNLVHDTIIKPSLWLSFVLLANNRLLSLKQYPTQQPFARLDSQGYVL